LGLCCSFGNTTEASQSNCSPLPAYVSLITDPPVKIRGKQPKKTPDSEIHADANDERVRGVCY
jgi:hypothetical protein